MPLGKQDLIMEQHMLEGGIDIAPRKFLSMDVATRRTEGERQKGKKKRKEIQRMSMKTPASFGEHCALEQDSTGWKFSRSIYQLCTLSKLLRLFNSPHFTWRKTLLILLH